MPQMRTQAQRAERLIKAYGLMLAGATYEQIADQCGYSDRSSAHRAIADYVRTRAKERDELADQATTVMLDQLDRLLTPQYVAALKGDTRAAEVALRIMDRKIRLQRLDDGPAIQVTHQVVTQSAIDDDLRRMERVLVNHATDMGIDMPELPAMRQLLARLDGDPGAPVIVDAELTTDAL